MLCVKIMKKESLLSFCSVWLSYCICSKKGSAASLIAQLGKHDIVYNDAHFLHIFQQESYNARQQLLWIDMPWYLRCFHVIKQVPCYFLLFLFPFFSTCCPWSNVSSIIHILTASSSSLEICCVFLEPTKLLSLAHGLQQPIYFASKLKCKTILSGDSGHFCSFLSHKMNKSDHCAPEVFV